MNARHKNCGPNTSRGSNRMFGPFGVISAELEDILSNVLHQDSTRGNATSKFSPRSNVSESETGYSISMELPGLSIDQIQVEVHEGRLTISGEKKIDHSDETKHVLVERQSGEFKREFEFTHAVDFDKISAQLTNGVLTIDVPKSEKAVPKKVNIQSV